MQHTLFATIQKSVLFLGLFLFVSLFSVQKSYGEAAITVGDDVKIKFGVLFQGQIDESQISGASADRGEYNQNILLRRARVIIGGQVAPNLTFFTETEAGFVGKQGLNTYASGNAANKNIETTGLNVLDAVLTWKPIDALNIDTGLILVPICRNCLQGAAMLLPINYASSSFVESVTSGSDIGRDTGVQLRSYLLNDKLEVRLGAFQGYRTMNSGSGTTGSTDPFRVTARVQYNVFDAEKGLFYTGTYLGKKQVLAIGAGYDEEGDYRAQAVDLFADLPVTGDLAVTVQVDNIRWMPSALITVADTDDWVVEAGLYVSSLKIQPFIQYEDQQYVNGITPDTRIFQGGLGYYFSGYNGNLKVSGGFKDTGLTNGYANQVTVQLQGFYF
jgi:hypothetical protein